MQSRVTEAERLLRQEFNEDENLGEPQMLILSSGMAMFLLKRGFFRGVGGALRNSVGRQLQWEEWP